MEHGRPSASVPSSGFRKRFHSRALIMSDHLWHRFIFKALNACWLVSALSLSLIMLVIIVISTVIVVVIFVGAVSAKAAEFF